MGNGRKPYNLALPMLAWVSHHDPSKAQIRDLEARGFQVVRIGRERQNFRSGLSAWRACCVVCRRTPDVIMAILPKRYVWELSRFANPIPVIQTRMEFVMPDTEPIWTGCWDRVVGYRQMMRDEGRGIRHTLYKEEWSAEA